MKKTVLFTSDHGSGIGDAVMCYSSILDLSKQYNVRVMVSNNGYEILKKLDNNKDIIIHCVNTQQYYYTNDYDKSYCALYWQIKNNLKQYGMHALNVIRQTCNLPLYDQTNKQELPDIPINPKSFDKIYNMVKYYNLPIIITQPYLSYYNKMISTQKYLDIIKEINKRKIGIVIQIGKSVPDNMISPYGINLIGKTNLDESLALLKLSDLVITCESFLAHATACLKIPTIVFFCGTHPNEFGYNFHENIYYPEIVYCQTKCGRPTRWLYDYEYKDLNNCNSRNDNGWICPSKLCEKVIKVEDVLDKIEKQLSIGKDRDWRFYNNI